MSKGKQQTYNLHPWYGDLLVSVHFKSERAHLEGPNII